MAFFLTLGFRSFDSKSPIEVIYAGSNGDEEAKALSAVEPGKFVRAERLVNPRGIPARLPAVASETKSAEPKKPITTKAKL